MSETEEQEELELSDEELARNDEIYNAVFDCIKILTETDDLEWNMEVVGHVTDVIKKALAKHHLHVRYPCVVTESDGTQHKSSM